MTDEILTAAEAAALLKVGKNALYDLTHVDGFPVIRVGRSVRIPKNLLLAWVEAQARKEN